MKKANKMSNECPNAALYGLVHSNRNFKERIYWGKNQFNSSFPIALCCYMRDRGVNALGISMKSDLTTEISEMPFHEVFGTNLPNDQIFFRFESDFSPFKKLVEDSLEKIDVVVVENETQKEIRPLEIKLTTLPDDGTSDFDESKYGSEIVVRSPTMRYVALSMASSNKDNLAKIKKIFEPVCKTVDNWENIAEMKSRQDKIFAALKKFLSEYCHTQKPLLVQPIWKTIRKTPQLAENCLDVFVWTDFAIVKLILESLDEDESDAISCSQREAFRLTRFLYEISCGDAVYQGPIYEGMTLGNPNDQEFVVSVSGMAKHLSCDRFLKPAITKAEIKRIVLGNPPFEHEQRLPDFYDLILEM